MLAFAISIRSAGSPFYEGVIIGAFVRLDIGNFL
jgi:hypothetical protein